MLKIEDITLAPLGCTWRYIGKYGHRNDRDTYQVESYDTAKDVLRYFVMPNLEKTYPHSLSNWISELVPELINYSVQLSQLRSLVTFLRVNDDFQDTLDSLLIELEI